jgi:hypothetical protein
MNHAKYKHEGLSYAQLIKLRTHLVEKREVYDKAVSENKRARRAAEKAVASGKGTNDTHDYTLPEYVAWREIAEINTEILAQGRSEGVVKLHSSGSRDLDAWLRATLGKGDHCHLHQLLRGVPATDALWDRIDVTRDIEPRAAYDIMQRARRLCNRVNHSELPTTRSVLKALAEHDATPAKMRGRQRWYPPEVEKPLEFADVVVEASETASSHEFWDQIRSAFIARLNPVLSGVDQPDILNSYTMRIDILIATCREELKNIGHDATRGVCHNPKRKEVVVACRLLGVEPPRIGRPIDLIKAQRNKKKLCLLYHPDRNPGDKAKESLFRKVITAFNAIETYTRGEKNEQDDQCSESNC